MVDGSGPRAGHVCDALGSVVTLWCADIASSCDLLIVGLEALDHPAPAGPFGHLPLIKTTVGSVTEAVDVRVFARDCELLRLVALRGLKSTDGSPDRTHADALFRSLPARPPLSHGPFQRGAMQLAGPPLWQCVRRAGERPTLASCESLAARTP
jgi:hypothetical protein